MKEKKRFRDCKRVKMKESQVIFVELCLQCLVTTQIQARILE